MLRSRPQLAGMVRREVQGGKRLTQGTVKWFSNEKGYGLGPAFAAISAATAD